MQAVNVNLTSLHLQGITSSGSQNGSGGTSDLGSLVENTFQQAIKGNGLSLAKYQQASGNSGASAGQTDQGASADQGGSADQAGNAMQSAQQNGSATQYGQLQRDLQQLSRLLNKLVKLMKKSAQQAGDKSGSGGANHAGGGQSGGASGGGQSGGAANASAAGSSQSGGDGTIFAALAQLGSALQQMGNKVKGDASQVTNAVNGAKGTQGTQRQDAQNGVVQATTQLQVDSQEFTATMSSVHTAISAVGQGLNAMAQKA